MKNNIIFTAFLMIFNINAQLLAQAPSDTTDRIYIKIEVKGLACPYCAFGLEKDLKKVAGVEAVEIELKEGLVYISTPISQKPSKENLTKVIEDSGFTAGNIEYSKQEFEKSSSKKKSKSRRNKNH